MFYSRLVDCMTHRCTTRSRGQTLPLSLSESATGCVGTLAACRDAQCTVHSGWSEHSALCAMSVGSASWSHLARPRYTSC